MSTAQPLPQLRASLWADARTRVHAVVDGSVVPGLPQRLAEAVCGGWDCLTRGALSAEAAAGAAYVVELAPSGEFTDWLLGDAAAAHPGWGVVLVSPQPLLRAREHCRWLATVTLPSGERRRWRWWDPELLALLLPGCSAAQLDELFALGQRIVVPGRDEWIGYRLDDGVLATESRRVLKPER